MVFCLLVYVDRENAFVQNMLQDILQLQTSRHPTGAAPVASKQNIRNNKKLAEPSCDVRWSTERTRDRI